MTVASKIVVPVEGFFARHRKTRIALYLVGAALALTAGAVWAQHKARVYVREVVMPRAQARAEAYVREKVIPLVVAQVEKRVMAEVSAKLGDLIPGGGGLSDVGKLLQKPAPAAPGAGFGVDASWLPRSITPSTQPLGSTAPHGRSAR